ncbi:MAG TPA: EAL domain-containing protein [Candidatus Obscuribacterales bacterium]
MNNKLSNKFRSLLSIVTTRSIRKINQYIVALTLGQSVLATSVLITSLVLGVKQLGVLQGLELAAFDQMVRLQPDEEPDPRLLVVAIVESDIQAQKQWPLSDRTLAQVLKKLQQYQPKAIGLDLFRNVPEPPGREELLQQLQAPNIITINKLGEKNNESVPAITGLPEERIGFNDFVADPDGVVRRNFIYAFQGKEKFYSLSLRLGLLYLADRGISLTIEPNALKLGKTVFVPLDANSGGYQNIDAAGYQVLLSYRSRDNVARQVTVTQVLNGQVDPAWIKDKVVLIGTTAPSIKDFIFTPYKTTERTSPRMAGVIVHAQLVSQILSAVVDSKPLIWFLPEWGEGLWVWAWSCVGGVLAWRLRHPLSLGLAGTVGLGGLWGICFGIFTQAGWIPLIPPALALVTTGVSVLAYKLLHNAFHDPLTNLPNRDFFLKQLQWAISQAKLRQNAQFAVLFLDLDRFNVINNSLGLDIGEQLLVSTTRRLKECLRRRDILARVGGDEFAILLEDISNVSQATNVADKIQQEMTLPFRLNGQDIFTSLSIGIALSQPEYEHQPESLLRDAHTAMYRAKALGKARHELFATGMRAQIVRRLQLETDLRLALEKHEFRLHYQPIVSLQTGRIVGFESLVRWQHPQQGLVSPAEFIPVTEETGLIIPLGQWIFQEACRQLRIWQEQFPTNPPLMMSINLSGQQFSQPDLVEQIQQTIKITGLDGSSLKLEITESIAMNDVESAIAILLRLKSLDMRLSIDDFGTGYSSLSYLHRFPVDTLKVDRSFVSHMENSSENEAIVQTIIMLSHNLGMDVIAEGVETAAQQAKLQALNCEYGQGYFFSKPLPSEAATALLAATPQW